MATSHEEMEDRAYSEMPKGGNNKLYHVVVKFKIPPSEGERALEFEVNAIVDTGCTCCCINSNIMTKETPSLLPDFRLIVQKFSYIPCLLHPSLLACSFAQFLDQSHRLPSQPLWTIYELWQ